MKFTGNTMPSSDSNDPVRILTEALKHLAGSGPFPLYRPRLFLSMDFSGSTPFKQSAQPAKAQRAKPSAGDGELRDQKVAQPWLEPFAKFFPTLDETLRAEWLRIYEICDDDLKAKLTHPKKTYQSTYTQEASLPENADAPLDERSDGTEAKSNVAIPHFYQGRGDEAIYCLKLHNEAQAIVAVWAFINATESIRRLIQKEEMWYPLDVKSAAWLAEFPVANAEIVLAANYTELAGPPDSAIQSHYLMPFLFRVGKMPESNFVPHLTKHLVSVSRRNKAPIDMLSNAIRDAKKSADAEASEEDNGETEPFEARCARISQFIWDNKHSWDEVVRFAYKDYVGPQHDLGFRLAAKATPRKMILSLDLAYLLAKFIYGSIDRIDKVEDAEKESRQSTGRPPYNELFFEDTGKDSGAHGSKADERRLPPRTISSIASSKEKAADVCESTLGHLANRHFFFGYDGRVELKGVRSGIPYPMFFLHSARKSEYYWAEETIKPLSRARPKQIIELTHHFMSTARPRGDTSLDQWLKLPVLLPAGQSPLAPTDPAAARKNADTGDTKLGAEIEAARATAIGKAALLISGQADPEDTDPDDPIEMRKRKRLKELDVIDPTLHTKSVTWVRERLTILHDAFDIALYEQVELLLRNVAQPESDTGKTYEGTNVP